LETLQLAPQGIVTSGESTSINLAASDFSLGKNPVKKLCLLSKLSCLRISTPGSRWSEAFEFFQQLHGLLTPWLRKADLIKI
jgi:hypothetical protein